VYSRIIERGGPYCCETSRLPHFLDIQLAHRWRCGCQPYAPAALSHYRVSSFLLRDLLYNALGISAYIASVYNELEKVWKEAILA
jgi:hypothetical protein